MESLSWEHSGVARIPPRQFVRWSSSSSKMLGVRTWRRSIDEAIGANEPHANTGRRLAEGRTGRIRVRGDHSPPGSSNARGVAIGSSPIPYRLDYVLETGTGFVTTLLDVSSRGTEWNRRLVLRGDSMGSWTINVDAEGSPDLRVPGGDPAALAGALDCDLGLSPVTNLMPVLRYGLLSGVGQAELTAAWVSVPALRVQPDGQRYTGADTNLIRYEALDGSFSATITVDDDGLVVDYPGIASRIRAGSD
jgi:uncharacterized protein